MLSWGKARSAIFLCAILAILASTTAADGDDCPSSTSYLCQDGKKCIDKQYLCNHIMDCPDRDDETDCGKKYQLSIRERKFILEDLSDMKQCKDDKFFRCRTGDKCISKSLTCDQVADCEDASDESDALCEGHPPDHVNKPCDPKKEFECEAKICIPIGLVCDGTKHCFDGRDEEPEMCKKSYSEKNVSLVGKCFILITFVKFCRQHARVSFAKTNNAFRATLGSATDSKTVQTEATNCTARHIARFRPEDFYARTRLNASSWRRCAMGRTTAMTKATKADLATIKMLAIRCRVKVRA